MGKNAKNLRIQSEFLCEPEHLDTLMRDKMRCERNTCVHAIYFEDNHMKPSASDDPFLSRPLHPKNVNQFAYYC